MTTQTTTIVGTPTLPRVNLLPPEIAEARLLNQYRVGAATAVVVACLGVAGLYVNAHSGIASAQSSLTASQAKGATLQTQLSKLGTVTQLQNEVVGAQQTLATALAPEILWSHYLQDMSVALAGNYWFTTLVLNNTPVAGATPLADASAIGSISITGKAVTHYDVAKLLTALANEKGLSHPTLSSSVEDTSPLTGTNVLLTSFTVAASIDSNDRPVVSTPAATSGTAGTGSTPTTPPTTTSAGH